MRETRPPRIPVLPLALGSLAGAWCALGLDPWLAALPLWLVLRAGSWCGLGTHSRLVWFLSGIVLGFAAARLDVQQAEARLDRWGAVQERQWTLQVTGAPEPTPRGGRVFPARVERGALRVQVRVGGREGGRLDGLRRGQELRVWGRLELPRAPASGEFDLRRWLRVQGFDGTLWVKSARLVEGAGSETSGGSAEAGGLRRLARQAVVGEGGGQAGRLVAAMVLGEREGLSSATKRTLRSAGLGHLLAISGLHLGLVAWGLTGAWKRVVRFVPWGALACAAAVWLYADVTGSRIPACRAALMFGWATAGRLLGREGQPLNGLAWAALGLLLWRPTAAADPSYALSFLATAGILLFAAPIAAHLPLPRSVALACGVTAAAYVATAPVVALEFGRLAPIALLTNLVAAPLCALVLLGAAVAVAGALIPGASLGLGRAAAHAAASALLRLSEAVEASGLGGRWVSPWPLPFAAVYYALLLELACRLFRGGGGHASRPWRGALWLALVLFHLGPPPALLRPRAAAVEVLDVGQGQAVVLRAATGHCVVVDAATGEAHGDGVHKRVLPALARAGCTQLDALWLSHADADHAGGAPATLRELAPEVLLYPLAAWKEFAQKLQGVKRPQGTRFEGVVAGAVRRWGTLRFEVIHPPATYRGSPNDRSLVLRFEADRCSALLPGDLEGSGEAHVLASREVRPVELLLLGHHGAADATSEAWLDALQPRVAAVSAGRRNPFGHPTLEVLERLRRRGIRLWRTDRHGTVRLDCREGTWRVRAARSSR